jgi:hypothetical protein
MQEDALKKLLHKVSSGNMNVDEALGQLKDFEYKDMGFAK